jgi:uncharacterized OsmC-like protein
MQRKVTVRCLAGKQRLGIARNHAVVTDRTLDGGGTDLGCTSGELLLLAIGSCSIGGIRSYLEECGVAPGNLSVEVGFEPHPDSRRRDRIVIVVNVDSASGALDAAAIRAAATSGRVSSRINAESDLEVRIATPSQ